MVHYTVCYFGVRLPSILTRTRSSRRPEDISLSRRRASTVPGLVTREPRRVFLSVGTPHLPIQEAFLKRLIASLRARGLQPWTLGRSDYDYRNPLSAISEAMDTCYGAVILGLGRRLSPVVFERFGSSVEERRTDLITATPWNHLEAGMAYQLGLPLLILKDRTVASEGILDQAIGDYLVYEFDLSKEAASLSAPLRSTLAVWARDVFTLT
jgi:hypothetical protein